MNTSTALTSPSTCYGSSCAAAGVAVVGGTALAEGSVNLVDHILAMYIVNFVVVAIILVVLFPVQKWQVALPKKFWSTEKDTLQFWSFVLALWILFFSVISLIIKFRAYSENSDKLNNDAYYTILIPSSPMYLAILIILIILLIICVGAMLSH